MQAMSEYIRVCVLACKCTSERTFVCVRVRACIRERVRAFTLMFVCA